MFSMGTSPATPPSLRLGAPYALGSDRDQRRRLLPVPSLYRDRHVGPPAPLVSRHRSRDMVFAPARSGRGFGHRRVLPGRGRQTRSASSWCGHARSTALRLLHHHGEQARAFVADKLKAALSDAAQEGQRRQTAVELEVEYDGGMIPVATLEPMPVEPGQEAETTPVRGAPKKRKTCRWEEVKVGLAQKPGEASRIYSVRPTGELDEAFRDLLAIACLQGWGEHTEVRGIADGAHYLRTRMEDTFRACPFRCILDRPHAKEHLSDVSKRLESKQLISVSAKQWYATAVRRLEHGDVDKLIGELGHAFDRSQDDDIRKQAEYFERNKDAVSYGDYRDHGGSTASSEVDSAHRHVVQKRLKIPGAWWHPDNVRNILALRMLKANRWWDEYWELQRQQWRTRAQRLRNQRLPDNRNPDTEISTPINEGHNLIKTRGSNGFESHPAVTRGRADLDRDRPDRAPRRPARESA